VYGIDNDFVSDQFDSVLTDMPVDATKTGMLGTRQLVELVAERAGRGGLGFLVVDPVMVATSGHRLLEEDAVDAVRTLMVPAAHVITPNLPEAALLLGDDVEPARDLDTMRYQARELIERGARGVLVKGGHGEGDEVLDVLALNDGTDVTLAEYRHQRISTPNTHGTGCTLSAVIPPMAKTGIAEVAMRFLSVSTPSPAGAPSLVAVSHTGPTPRRSTPPLPKSPWARAASISSGVLADRPISGVFPMSSRTRGTLVSSCPTWT